MQEKQIKSKDRVRQVAEVFTAKKQVLDMLDLVKDASNNHKLTVLEPSCGNGNFLAEVLGRKLMRVLELLKMGRFPPQEKVELRLDYFCKIYP